MSGDLLIKAEGVSKKFCSRLKTSMKYGVFDIAKDFVGLPSRSDTLRQNEFWSVDDVSFEVRRGECLGLIGPNGAGKSTLLKMLNGIIMPDKGSVEIQGRVGALIEVGAGFHPLLTGRENIYINGAIMGLRKKEIDQKFDSIVEFAELGDFINTPVSYYSSGMYVRLGFAVAAHLEPDVLLIDEVLAVGDMGFRAKCYTKISELMNSCAVVFVSHFMPHVAKLCDKVVVLNHGKLVSNGLAMSGIEAFNDLFHDHKMVISGTREAEISNLVLLNKNGTPTERFFYNELFELQFDITVSENYDEFKISLTFMNQDTNLIAQSHSEYNDQVFKNNGKKHRITVKIDRLILNPGKYYMNIIVFDKTNTKHLVWHYAAKKFKVSGGFQGGAPVQFVSDWDHSIDGK